MAGFNYAKLSDRNAPQATDVEGRAVNFSTCQRIMAQPSASCLLLNNDTDIRQNRGYVATRLKPTGSLAVNAGLRSSNYRYRYTYDYMREGDGADEVTGYRDSDVVTPYAGLVCTMLPNQTLYASYTSVFKPQSVRDRTGAGLKPAGTSARASATAPPRTTRACASPRRHRPTCSRCGTPTGSAARGAD